MSTTTDLIIPCDDRCMFAKGDDCDCECGGKNHKQGFRLPAHQREVHRTRAGRRIALLTPGTKDYQMAARWLDLRDNDGWTQKEIAHQFNVSAPTVRRLITRLLHTLAAMETAAKQAA
jgi:DNA-directed RNA polymerase sigma subunit (sigma70/sigma32)